MNEFQNYSVGDKDLSGQEVSIIVGRTPEFIVYLTKDRKIRFEYDDNILQRISSAIVEFNKLMAIVAFSLSPRKQHIATIMIAHELYSAFLSEDDVHKADQFKNSKSFIEDNAQERLKVCYVFFSLVGYIIILTTLIYLSQEYIEFYEPYLYAFYYGLSGGLLSILVKNRELEFPILTETKYLVFQGILKLLMGGIFGLFAFFLMKAELLLAPINDKKEFLILISFAAGFSERLVPDILNNLKGQYSNMSKIE